MGRPIGVVFDQSSQRDESGSRYSAGPVRAYRSCTAEVVLAWHPGEECPNIDTCYPCHPSVGEIEGYPVAGRLARGRRFAALPLERKLMYLNQLHPETGITAGFERGLHGMPGTLAISRHGHELTLCGGAVRFDDAPIKAMDPAKGGNADLRTMVRYAVFVDNVCSTNFSAPIERMVARSRAARRREDGHLPSHIRRAEDDGPEPD